MNTQEYFKRAMIEGIETREIPISTSEELSFIVKLAKESFKEKPVIFGLDERSGLHYRGHFTRSTLQKTLQEAELRKFRVDTMTDNSGYSLIINEDLLWGKEESHIGFVNGLNKHLCSTGDEGIFAAMAWNIDHSSENRKKFIDILESIGYSDFRSDNEGIFAYHPRYKGILRIPNLQLYHFNEHGCSEFEFHKINDFINCFYWQRKKRV